jgi:uncharacterized protein with GYD domain
VPGGQSLLAGWVGDGIPFCSGGKKMPKFALFFTLTGETIANAMERPSDRRSAVSQAAEAAGGRLESYYWMHGHHDGFVVLDLPDSAAASAVSLVVGSTGAFQHLETHELFEAEQINPILAKAKELRSAYRPPGA